MKVTCPKCGRRGVLFRFTNGEASIVHSLKRPVQLGGQLIHTEYCYFKKGDDFLRRKNAENGKNV